MSTCTLIVSEHRTFAECLAKVLELSAVSCRFARDRDEALRELAHSPSDLVLLDHLGRSEESVLKLVSEIHRECDAARVLVMNGPPREQKMTRYIEGGAAGFLSKEHSFRELVDAIHCVVEHSAKCAADQAALVFARLQELSCERENPANRGAHPLTFREIDVLRLIDMGRSNKEIAAELHLSVHTVKSHVHHILEKAGASNRREAVYLALHKGWMDASKSQ